MTCSNPLGIHKEKRQAVNQVIIVRTWENQDRFYLCSDCTASVQQAATYKNAEIIVKNVSSETRCRSCGALLIKGKCPVEKKDCGR
jgi:DNA-directed RNA polymerase subunit RPC12/RpoP